MIVFLRPKMTTIRRAQLSDAETLRSLHSQGFERAWGVNEFEGLLFDSSVVTHIASHIGFIMSRIAADEAEILSFVVAKQSRRKGIASKLLATHIASLAQVGVQNLFLEVDEFNMAAIKLYTGFGFDNVGKRNAYYKRDDGSTSAAIVMKRGLG